MSTFRSAISACFAGIILSLLLLFTSPQAQGAQEPAGACYVDPSITTSRHMLVAEAKKFGISLALITVGGIASGLTMGSTAPLVLAAATALGVDGFLGTVTGRDLLHWAEIAKNDRKMYGIIRSAGKFLADQNRGKSFKKFYAKYSDAFLLVGNSTQVDENMKEVALAIDEFNRSQVGMSYLLNSDDSSATTMLPEGKKFFFFFREEVFALNLSKSIAVANGHDFSMLEDSIAAFRDLQHGRQQEEAAAMAPASADEHTCSFYYLDSQTRKSCNFLKKEGLKMGITVAGLIAGGIATGFSGGAAAPLIAVSVGVLGVDGIFGVVTGKEVYRWAKLAKNDRDIYHIVRSAEKFLNDPNRGKSFKSFYKEYGRAFRLASDLPELDNMVEVATAIAQFNREMVAMGHVLNGNRSSASVAVPQGKPMFFFFPKKLIALNLSKSIAAQHGKYDVVGQLDEEIPVHFDMERQHRVR